jgi:hypothetical protein
MAQENPPSATNAERARDISAGGVKSVPIVSQPRDARPTFAQRLERRRRVAFELDRLLESELYAVAPSREAALDG